MRRSARSKCPNDPTGPEGRRTAYPRAKVAVLLAMLLLLTGCATLELSPVTDPPSGRWDPGSIAWRDLLTDRPDASRRFYGQLFGWTFETRDRYTLARLDGSPVAGIVTREDPADDRPPALWVPYFSVEDVDWAAGAVAAAGGSVLKGPAQMRHRGRFALVADPRGARMILLRAVAGDPPAENRGSGDWLWDELWTDDTVGSLAFYGRLGGFTPVQPAGERHREYWVLTRDDRWYAGVTTLPVEGIPSQWVPVIRIDDPVAALAKVEDLGGRVLVRPDQPPGGGRVALIADPGGALLMIEAWQPAPAEKGGQS